MISYHPNENINYNKPWDYVTGNRAVDVFDLERIAECVKRFFWSPIVFKQGHRCQDNFLTSHFCAMDFDDLDMSLQEAMDAFQDCNVIIGTTKSHQRVKGGVVCDRFRVIIPWEKPINDLLTYKYNMSLVAQRYPLDKKATDGARGFWPCNEIVMLQQGPDYECQEVITDFDRLQYEDTLGGANHIKIYNKMLENKRKGIMPRNVAKWLDCVIPIGERNEACYRLARDLYVTKLERDAEAVYRFIIESKTYAATEITRKLDMEIRARIKSGQKKAKSIVENIRKYS